MNMNSNSYRHAMHMVRCIQNNFEYDEMDEAQDNAKILRQCFFENALDWSKAEYSHALKNVSSIERTLISYRDAVQADEK